MGLLYDTELHYIYEEFDKDGALFPLPPQQHRPRTKNYTRCCWRMPRINMVVGLIGRLNTIKEEATENTEPPIKQSLELVGLLVKMMFDLWLGHFNGFKPDQ